jgi:hypothetical protein
MEKEKTPQKVIDLVKQAISKKDDLLNQQDVLRTQHKTIETQLKEIGKEISSLGYLVNTLVSVYTGIPEALVAEQAQQQDIARPRSDPTIENVDIIQVSEVQEPEPQGNGNSPTKIETDRFSDSCRKTRINNKLLGGQLQ